MPPKIITAKPVRDQVADHLREQIMTGRYPAGQPIPPEERLADVLGVTRYNIRQAVKELVQEGLLEVRRPHGTTVRDPHARPPIHPRGLSLADGRYVEHDTRIWSEIGKPSYVQAQTSTTMADLLAVPAGEPMLCRSVLQEAPDGTRREVRLSMPFSVAARETPWMDDPHLPPPLDVYTWYHHTGLRLTFTEYVRTRMPVADERAALRMPAVTPLIITTRVAATTEHPITVEETRIAGDQAELSYPVPVTPPATEKPTQDRQINR